MQRPIYLPPGCCFHIQHLLDSRTCWMDATRFLFFVKSCKSYPVRHFLYPKLEFQRLSYVVPLVTQPAAYQILMISGLQNITCLIFRIPIRVKILFVVNFTAWDTMALWKIWLSIDTIDKLKFMKPTLCSRIKAWHWLVVNFTA